MPAAFLVRGTDVPKTVPFHGTVAGVIGAFVVAAVFLAVDGVAGYPLYTPNALGAALFRGEWLDPAAPIEPILVLGYTLAHGTVFVGFGLIGAVVELEARVRSSDRTRELVATALVALALLGAFQLTVGIFGWLFIAGAGPFGGPLALLANTLAALTMSAYLTAVRLRYAARLQGA